jgi:hypothetical protein
LDVKLGGGSFSQSAVIELSLELVLLIARVGASLGSLDALLLTMMLQSGWDSRTEFVCVSRESLTKFSNCSDIFSGSS